MQNIIDFVKSNLLMVGAALLGVWYFFFRGSRRRRRGGRRSYRSRMRRGFSSGYKRVRGRFGRRRY